MNQQVHADIRRMLHGSGHLEFVQVGASADSTFEELPEPAVKNSAWGPRPCCFAWMGRFGCSYVVRTRKL